MVGIGPRYNPIIKASHSLPDMESYLIRPKRAKCFKNLPLLPVKNHYALGAFGYGGNTHDPLKLCGTTALWTAQARHFQA